MATWSRAARCAPALRPDQDRPGEGRHDRLGRPDQGLIDQAAGRAAASAAGRSRRLPTCAPSGRATNRNVRPMAMSVGGERRRRRPDVGHQHDAARRRHAGAADHLPDHRAGRDPDRAAQAADRCATSRPTTKPENVNLSVKGDAGGSCVVYWGKTKVNSQELLKRSVAQAEGSRSTSRAAPARRGLGQSARGAYPRRRQHAVHVHRRRGRPTLQRAGFHKVGFISQPTRPDPR